MSAAIQRYADTIKGIQLATTTAASTAIPFGSFGYGVLHLAAGSQTYLTWYASMDGITYYALLDGTGTAGTGNPVTSSVTTAASAVQIPSACQGAKFLKAIADSATTADVVLKS